MRVNRHFTAVHKGQVEDKTRRIMMPNLGNQEALGNGPTRRQAILSVAIAFRGLALVPTEDWAAAEEKISHTAEAIHQDCFQSESVAPLGSASL
jgi:hypothetical protein